MPVSKMHGYVLTVQGLIERGNNVVFVIKYGKMMIQFVMEKIGLNAILVADGFIYIVRFNIIHLLIYQVF
jgi:hypothetical protein